MMKRIQAIKGMNDVRPDAERAFLNSTLWQGLGAVSAELLESYGYRHIWLPVVESTELFARGLGEGTDVVSKEMYTFEDRGGRSLTLRPEATAGAVRAYVEHGLFRAQSIQKWWYWGPMFRAEQPQEGRYRQFYQLGAEMFGVAGAAADAEVLTMLARLIERLELREITLKLNTLGDAAGRGRYREVLSRFLDHNRDGLSDASRRRLGSNPLRFLDSKDPADRELKHNAPDILDSLSPESRAHFDEVRALLDAQGIAFERDSTLVRGLDYYTETTFEFVTDALGSQDAILGGGRYDGLVERLGGPATPAVGFAAGVERLAMLIERQHGVPDPGPDLYLVPMEGCLVEALRLADAVRAVSPCTVELDVSSRRIKSALKRADKLRARAALVLGEDECRSQRGSLRMLGVSSNVEVILTGEAIALALQT